MDWLKRLIAKCLADPNFAAKLKALWDALMAFRADLPEAEAVDFSEFDAAVAELVPADAPPEALGDGIAVLRKLWAFAQAHPEILQVLTWIAAIL